jgi:hypothetical protein
MDELTFDEIHELVDPLVVAMRVPLTTRDENRVEVVRDIVWPRDLAAFGLNDVLHHGLDAKLRVMVVSCFDEEVVEDFTKATDLSLCVWMCLIGLED